MDMVDPQKGGDKNLAPQPTPAQLGDVPQMDLERTLPRQVSTGMSRGNQQLGSPNLYTDAGDNQIIVKDVVPRVVMGNQTTFGEGFYVTKPGFDATSESDLANFIFNSNQNIFKIVKTDTITVDIVSAPTSYVGIEHGLGFAPIPMAFLTNVTDSVISGNFPFPVILAYDDTVVPGAILTTAYARVAADSTYVYFEFINALGLTFTGFDIRYYLLQETSG